MSGSVDDDIDAAYPPQLCPTCARPLDADMVADDSMLLALWCPEHGEVGVLDPRDLL